MTHFDAIMEKAELNRFEAACELGRGLMRGNREQFKLGYGPKAAFLAVMDTIKGINDLEASELQAHLEGFALGMAEDPEQVLPA